MEFEITDDVLDYSCKVYDIQQQLVLLQLQHDWDNIKSINMCDNNIDIMLSVEFQESIIDLILKVISQNEIVTTLELSTKAEDMIVIVDYVVLDDIINKLNDKIQYECQLEHIFNIINCYFNDKNDEQDINSEISNSTNDTNISDSPQVISTEIDDYNQDSEYDDEQEETDDDSSVNFNDEFDGDVYKEFYEDNVLDKGKFITECEKQLILEKKAIEIFDEEKNKRSGLQDKVFNRDEIIKIVFNELSYVSNLDTSKISVEPDDNNIFRWIVTMGMFSHDSELYKDLNELHKKGYDTKVVISVDINPILYPYYPPTIKILKPMFKKGLSYGISNMDYFNPSKWNPTNNMKLTINSIYDIIELYGRIDIENMKGSETDLNDISMLQSTLEQLSIKTSVKPTSVMIVNKYHIDYVPLNVTNNTNDDRNGKYWKSGTGFGFGKQDGWDVKEYMSSDEEKNVQVTNLLLNILNILKDDGDTDKYYSCINDSCLIPVLNEYIEGCSMLELGDKIEIYKVIYDIVNFMTKPLYIKLLNNQTINSTYKIFSKIYDESCTFKNTVIANPQVNMDTDLIGVIEYIIELYDNMTFLILSSNEKLDTLTEKDLHLQLGVEEKYVKELKVEQYGTMDVINSGYSYKKEIGKSVTAKSIQRVMKEITSFTRDTLPLSFSSTISVRVDEHNINALKCMITGPDNTPYHGGCFLFDIMIPNNYPNDVPNFLLVTTGEGTVRFNPNLYKNGKVCLSLLGTWSGHSSESWIPEKSTLIQVFVSIQSLIFVEDPYFNEPSYESSMHSEHGKQESFKYNDSRRFSTVKWAMIDQIKHPKKGFEMMIKKHFYYKKESIIKEVTKWVNETKISGFNNLLNELKTELDNIKL